MEWWLDNFHMVVVGIISMGKWLEWWMGGWLDYLRLLI